MLFAGRWGVEHRNGGAGFGRPRTVDHADDILNWAKP
jgi:hypothetical protein